MNTFVISDLHIGDGGPRDNFAIGGREQQLNSFLDYVERQYGKLIILGDLFEFWQMNPSKIIMQHLPLLDRLARMDAIYVVGNHDDDLQHFIGTEFLTHPFFNKMCGSFEQNFGEKCFKFMHGHEVDASNSSDTPYRGRIVSILAGMAKDRNKSPLFKSGDFVEDNLEKIIDGFLGRWFRIVNEIKAILRLGGFGFSTTPAQNPNRIKRIHCLYRQDWASHNYDVLVTGHTHRPGFIGGWYINSGTWARKTNTFVQISPTGDAVLFDWVKENPVPNNVALELDLKLYYKMSLNAGIGTEIQNC
ncbi:MAG: UDP-2,3-diacylglucosamine diphosphatase [Proteobacteria bacterium]|jgi:UDP-2,3-diacylglucosamine pyrophosphatase LpxH|nr:UDP-2,3-diacylglucosamine diphosphatase [Pseudomonadota bacterium]